MKKFSKPRQSLVAAAVTAVVGGAALMSAPTAQAMNFAQDGLGQVLLFPYYTVNNGWDTYLHITNTSSDTVIAKVRFREAKNSREVRDFNIILSPNDVWTAAVTEDGDGAKLVTYDTSCTSPMIPVVDGNGRREIGFTSIGYDGSDARYNYDNGGRGIERTREGYFEVIMMGRSSGSTSTSTNLVEYNAKHVNGVPRDCQIVDQQFVTATPEITLNGEDQFSNFVGDGNVLKGFSTLINVPIGQAAGVEPAVLSNFTADPLIYAPGSLLPSLADGNAIQDGYFFNPNDTSGNGAQVFVASGTAPEDTVSGLLQRRWVINEFSAAASTRTDWVITFPTKHHYTDDAGENDTTGSVVAPFTEWFAKAPTDLTNNLGKSCDPIGVSEYGREEEVREQLSNTSFSPRPSGPSGLQLCNEVNVLTFNGSAVLGSSVQAYDINTSEVGPVGWMRIRLGNTGGTAGVQSNPLLDDSGVGYHGLPVIGFALTVRNNAAEAGNNRNYATAQEHSFERLITTP